VVLLGNQRAALLDSQKVVLLDSQRVARLGRARAARLVPSLSRAGLAASRGWLVLAQAASAEDRPLRADRCQQRCARFP
jgi:hypothetical protein